MTLQKINTRNTVLFLIIIAATAFRLLSFKYTALSNFTPVGAIALFGGAYFTDKWKAYVFVLIMLIASDLVINYLYFSRIELFASSIWLYICFAIMIFIGSLIKKVNAVNVGLASIAGILVHWLIMDLPWLHFGVKLYPNTLVGYGQSLIAAIPFEKNMVLGDIVFCAILFGGFELAKRKYTILRTNKMAV
jgi:hypothetical protein